MRPSRRDATAIATITHRRTRSPPDEPETQIVRFTQLRPDLHIAIPVASDRSHLNTTAVLLSEQVNNPKIAAKGIDGVPTPKPRFASDRADAYRLAMGFLVPKLVAKFGVTVRTAVGAGSTAVDRRRGGLHPLSAVSLRPKNFREVVEPREREVVYCRP